MSDPISFTSKSPRFGLPFLFAGQAQKEYSVNEAHALADMLLHPAVIAEQDAPPAAPADGECWLVGPNPSGDWHGHAGSVASMQAGNWLFASPRNGMRLFDESTGQYRLYRDGWHAASAIAEAQGGSTIDSEARTAIAGLIAALAAAGVLPST